MSDPFVKFTHAETNLPVWVRTRAIVAVAKPCPLTGAADTGAELMMAGTECGLHVTDDPELAVQRIRIAEDEL